MLISIAYKNLNEKLNEMNVYDTLSNKYDLEVKNMSKMEKEKEEWKKLKKIEKENVEEIKKIIEEDIQNEND